MIFLRINSTNVVPLAPISVERKPGIVIGLDINDSMSKGVLNLLET